MRFLQIVMSKGGRAAPPTPEELERVRKVTSDEIASGKLIAKGALRQRATDAARITSHEGEITVEDPPAGEGWMAGGGYALFEAASKDEAIQRAKATLAIMGDGVVELIQVTEMHPRPVTSS
jgi:hypothetical protein